MAHSSRHATRRVPAARRRLHPRPDRARWLRAGPAVRRTNRRPAPARRRHERHGPPSLDRTGRRLARSTSPTARRGSRQDAPTSWPSDSRTARSGVSDPIRPDRDPTWDVDQGDAVDRRRGGRPVRLPGLGSRRWPHRDRGRRLRRRPAADAHRSVGGDRVRGRAGPARRPRAAGLGRTRPRGHRDRHRRCTDIGPRGHERRAR